MISALRKRTAKSIYALNLETKAARAEMRKEIIYAVKSAAADAKSNLKKAVQWANGRFAALNTLAARNSKHAKAARAKLGASISHEQKRAKAVIANAVAAQNRALLALKSETAKKIKKTNRRISSYADQMAKNAKAVAAQMASDVATLQARISAAKAAQIRVNRRVNKEMGFIIKTANVRHSQSKRARGKLRAILNANKAAASEEVAALAKRTRFSL